MGSNGISSTPIFSLMETGVNRSAAGLWPVALDGLEKTLNMNTKLRASPARNLLFMYDNLGLVIYEIPPLCSVCRLYFIISPSLRALNFSQIMRGIS